MHRALLQGMGGQGFPPPHRALAAAHCADALVLACTSAGGGITAAAAPTSAAVAAPASESSGSGLGPAADAIAIVAGVLALVLIIGFVSYKVCAVWCVIKLDVRSLAIAGGAWGRHLFEFHHSATAAAALQVNQLEAGLCCRLLKPWRWADENGKCAAV